MKKIEDEKHLLFCYNKIGEIMNGVLLVKKEIGMTSRDVVDDISKIFHTKKVGHTGTLDPMAEGLLIVCIGEGTKLVELLTHDEKEYIAEVTLGIITDTLDKEGAVLKEEFVHKTKEEIETILKSMVGSYEQEVPIYSAIKKNGKKLYEYAREGKEIELPKREVTIHSLTLVKEPIYQDGKTIFQIKTKVSKGTYIRSLVRDIASNLGTIGMMSKLVRTKVGSYELKDAHTILEYQKGTPIMSIKEALKDFPSATVSKELEERIKHGSILNKENYSCPILFLNQEGNVLAIYKEYEKDKNKMKPWKVFAEKK